MTDEIPEIIDRSRVDAYAATRRRAMLMHAAWRPMAAGAVGAALMMGCVWIILPKVSTREIIVPAITMKETEVPKVTMRDVTADHVVPKDIEVEVPKVTMRNVEVPNLVLVPHDVQVDHFVPHDVQVDHFVPHDVQIDIPHIQHETESSPPPVISKFAPVTPRERAFVTRPEFQSAQFKGRLAADPDGLIRFDDGSVFVPALRDRMGKPVQDFSSEYLTKKYWGDLAFCNAIPTDEGLFECRVIHHDAVIDLETTRHAKGRPT